MKSLQRRYLSLAVAGIRYGLDPVNPALADNLSEISDKIVEAISPPRKNLFKQPLMPWVEICVDDPQNMMQMEDLNRAVIRYANRDALDLFDFLDQPDTWGDLVEVIEKFSNDDRWQNELFHVVRKIGSGRIPMNKHFLNMTAERFSSLISNTS